MNLGGGIVLLVIGLMFSQRIVTWDIPHVDEYRLGVLLTILGAVAVVLSMMVYLSHRRTTHVIDRRDERG
jgi:hypothetical protein